MNSLRRWWIRLTLVNRVVLWLLVGSAVVTALTFAGWLGRLNPAIWVPSLVCNLITTAIAIHFINHVLVQRQESARDDQMRVVAETLQLSLWLQLMIVLRRAGKSPEDGVRAMIDNKDGVIHLSNRIQETIQTYSAVFDFPFLTALHSARVALGHMVHVSRADDEDGDAFTVAMMCQMVLWPYEVLLERFPRIPGPRDPNDYGEPRRLLKAFKEQHGIVGLPD